MPANRGRADSRALGSCSENDAAESLSGVALFNSHGINLAAALKFLHFHSATDHQRRTLVDILRLDIHDPLLSVGRDATGLLRDEGQRIRFIQQAKFAVRMALGGRIKENAAF